VRRTYVCYVYSGSQLSFCALAYTYFQSGVTALHYAAHYGNNELVFMLLQRGADINAETKVKCVICTIPYDFVDLIIFVIR
jgi:hypothetical protein